MARRSNLDKQLDALVERFTPEIKAAFLVAIRGVTSRAVLSRIIAAIEIGDIEAAFRATGMTAGAMRPITAMLERAFESGGNAVAASAPGRALFTFDVRNSRAEAWIRQRSADLVTRVTEDTRDNLRRLIETGVREGRNPRNIALDIVGRVNPDTGRRTGGVIGLTQQQEQWVRNARRQLEQLDPAFLKREAVRVSDRRMFERAIKSEIPLTPPQINMLLDRYSDNLLLQRGETIARTESVQSLNKAADEAFQQAIDEGALTRNMVAKVWDSAGDNRVRETHRDMDGQTVHMDEPFVSPSGARLMFPGDGSLGAPADEIIQCRCRVRHDVDWFAMLGPEPEAPAPARPPETPEARNARLDREQQDYTLSNGRLNNIEYLSAFDEDTGEVFGRNEGTKANVQFTPEFESAIRDSKRSIIAHHNHPSSSSFSTQDLFVLTENPGLKGLWAHGHNGTSYYAEGARKKINNKTVQSAMIDLQRAMNAEVRMGGATPDQINAAGMNHFVSEYMLRRGWLKKYEVTGSDVITSSKPIIDKIFGRLGL